MKTMADKLVDVNRIMEMQDKARRLVLDLKIRIVYDAVFAQVTNRSDRLVLCNIVTTGGNFIEAINEVLDTRKIPKSNLKITRGTVLEMRQLFPEKEVKSGCTEGV